MSSQSLLTPVHVSLRKVERELIKQLQKSFEKLGIQFTVDSTGITVTAVPTLLKEHVEEVARLSQRERQNPIEVRANCFCKLKFNCYHTRVETVQYLQVTGEEEKEFFMTYLFATS